MGGSAIRALRETLAVIVFVLLGMLSCQSCAFAGQIELSTSVEALSGEASIDGNRLFVDEHSQVSKWKITYHIASMAQANQVSRIFAVDRYGPEWAIESASTSSGHVLISPPGKKGYGESIEWSGLILEPGGCASLTVILETLGDPASQEHGTTAYYVLNAGMVVEFAVGDGVAARESTDEGYSVEVRRTPKMQLTMSSPEMLWYIRRPGDYYVKAFSGTVASNALVVVTFTHFTNLENNRTGEALQVYYSLQTQHPGTDEWIPPEELSAMSLNVSPSEEAVQWALWQRVVLEEQSVGEYVGGGVITFAMQNVQDTFVDGG